jgi:hypothetical protein
MTDAASVGADERLRLFLALRLPEPVLDAIEADVPGFRTSPWPGSGNGRASARAARDGNIRSVRRGCLSVTTATRRGAVRSLGIGQPEIG